MATKNITDDGKVVWSEKVTNAAVMFAEGYSLSETAKKSGVSERSLSRLRALPEFMNEVVRLTYMVGVANRAHRLQMVNRVIRQKMQVDGTIDTTKDSLEWMKFAQSETDGAKIDLTKLFEADDE